MTLTTSARQRRRHNHSHRHRSAKLSVRLVLLSALVLLALATGNACGAPANGGLVVVESSSDASDAVPETTIAPAVPVATKERIPEFVAEQEWKEILPGQGIPRVR